MLNTNKDIDTALRTEDIEGLIASGAPDDEYSTEANEIAAALVKIPASELTQANIAAVIALVWAKHFNLSAQDIEKRATAFENIARRLIS